MWIYEIRDIRDRIKESLLPGNEERFDRDSLLEKARDAIVELLSDVRDAERDMDAWQDTAREYRYDLEATESDLEDVREVCERVARMPFEPWSNEYLIEEMAEHASMGIEI